MADNIDKIELEEVTPKAPPAKTENTPDTPKEWDELDGKSQERFKKIIAMRNEAIEKARVTEEELKKLKDKPLPVPPKKGDDGLTDEERAALGRIKEVGGFLTKEDMEVERKRVLDEVRAQEDRRLLETAHDKLETKYGSHEGYPSYDRQEVEKYMKDNGIYNPEAAYRNLYWDEIVSAETKKSGVNSKSQPYTERTKPKTSTATEWDPDTLAERLRKPDGKEFYLKNQEKIDKMYSHWRQEGLAK